MKSACRLLAVGFLACGLLAAACVSGDTVGGGGGRSGSGSGGHATSGGQGGFIGGGQGGFISGNGQGGFIGGSGQGGFIGGGQGGFVGGGQGGFVGGGTGGSAFTLSCTPTAPLVSDMEDGNSYYGTSCPKGSWYLFTKPGSNAAAIVTAAGVTGTEGSVTPVAGGDSATSLKSIHVSGSGQTNTLVGAVSSYDAAVSLTAALNQPSATMRGSLNATAYTGVKFSYKATGTIRFMIANANTDTAGGHCTASGATQCSAHAYFALPPAIGWTPISIPFISMMADTTFGNPSFVAPADFSSTKGQLYSLEWHAVVPATGPTPAWDLWVDNLTFY